MLFSCNYVIMYANQQNWYIAVAITFSIFLYLLNYLSWNNYCFLFTVVYKIIDKVCNNPFII